MVAVRSVEEIDREIASRTEKVDAMGATLVELEAHPGLEHVQRYPPTGRTAQRWTSAEQAHTRLWEDLASMTGILDQAKVVRARRVMVSNADQAELSNLLFGKPLEVSRQRIPLAQRSITTRAEAVQYIGLAELADRMSADYRTLIDFIEAVDAINSQVLSGLGPVQGKLDQAGVASPKELVDLLSVSANDPLSLNPGDVARRIKSISDGIADRAAEFAELAAVQADWAGSVDSTSAQLDALRATIDRAGQARLSAERSILSGPLPAAEDNEPELRMALLALTSPDAKALVALRERVRTAQRTASETEELAQGLLDRRGELSGRLTAYQAKAARLGLAEDVELLASGRIAAGLLLRRPCDLRAVTRAIADYQNQLTKKREAT